MKAKIYVDGDNAQIVFATRLFSILEGEELSDFTDRVRLAILADLDEAPEDGIDFVQIDADYLSDFTDAMLKSSYVIAVAPVQIKLLEDAMNERLIDFDGLRKAVKAPTITRTLEEAKASPEYKLAESRKKMVAVWTDEGVTYTGTVQTIYLNNAHTVINYNVKLLDGKIRSVSEAKKIQFFDA